MSEVEQENKYRWVEEMGEISGFGGAYEQTCRAMVRAGCLWFDAHPDADPKFRGYRGVYGLLTEENEDAKALSKAVSDAGGDGITGAMHQATVSAVLFIRKNGWAKFVTDISKKGGYC